MIIVLDDSLCDEWGVVFKGGQIENKSIDQGKT